LATPACRVPWEWLRPLLCAAHNCFLALGYARGKGQAEAILVAYDVMELDEQDVRQEALEERRRRLAKLLGANKAIRDGIQLSEAITGDGAAIFRHACGLGLEGIVSKRIGSRM
jgi:bifunctional non-homologous end joining protein LigD